MEDERLPLELRRDRAGGAMSRAVGVSLAAGRARAHRLPVAMPARHLAIMGRGLIVLGIIAAVLCWLISVGILVHDMVSWWAELAVRPLYTTIEGPPPGW